MIDFIDAGIEHSRAGRWEKGADYLGYVAERSHADLSKTSLYLSYLGCAIARIHGRTKEARTLCERAVKVEFYQPENWANLAEVMLIAQKRKEAIAAVQQGLKIDSQNERLQQVHESLGCRRRSVVGFLGRSNPVNYLLGRLRNDLLGSRRGGGAPVPPSLPDLPQRRAHPGRRD
jgi:tetratricopeptide (TPR) repeat protein